MSALQHGHRGIVGSRVEETAAASPRFCRGRLGAGRRRLGCGDDVECHARTCGVGEPDVDEPGPGDHSGGHFGSSRSSAHRCSASAKTAARFDRGPAAPHASTSRPIRVGRVRRGRPPTRPPEHETRISRRQSACECGLQVFRGHSNTVLGAGLRGRIRCHLRSHDSRRPASDRPGAARGVADEEFHCHRDEHDGERRPHAVEALHEEGEDERAGAGQQIASALDDLTRAPPIPASRARRVMSVRASGKVEIPIPSSTVHSTGATVGSSHSPYSRRPG